MDLPNYRGGYFVGQVIENQQDEITTYIPDGVGRWVCKYGDTYEGHWQNGKFNGYGRKIYNEGQLHEGNWVDDLPHG